MDNLKYLTPGTGGMLLGQGIAQQREAGQLKNQETLADIAAKQQTFGYNEQANPLRLQGLDLGNQKSLAELPGIAATSDLQGTKARVARGTADTDIASGNNTNRFKMLKEHYEEGQMYTDFFGSTATEIQQVPPMQRGAYLRDKATQMGLNVDDPRFAQVMGQAAQNPQMLHSLWSQSKAAIAKLTPAYIQAIETARMQGDKARDVANIQAGASRYSADRSYDARIEVAEERRLAQEAKTQQAKTLEALAAQYLSASNELPDGDPRKAALKVKAQEAAQGAQAIRMGQTGNKPDLGAMGIDATTAPTPLGGQPPAAKKPEVKSLADLQSMYPGVPPAKLQELYKKKFGVDLK